MTSRFATPKAFLQSLEARLRTEARAQSTDVSRLRQLLVFDRFLARIFLRYRDAVVLKGGIVVELRLGRARTTRDIDFRWTGGADDVLEQLRTAGQDDLGDFLSFEVSPDRHNPELNAAGMAYEGRRFRVEPIMAGKLFASPFGVDVAFAEPMTGAVDELPGSDFLAFADIEPVSVRVYPVPTHIAEKLHAFTMPRPSPNSRVKDLPDIALLARTKAFAAEELRAAIRTTFEHRRTHDVPTEVPAAPTFWEPVYAKMAADDELMWRTLHELEVAVRGFLNPVLAGSSGQWNSETWQWK
ncbi:MAG: nucleotidyl transferase AbiEii/AbiGii toxin family protein [Polyangiales bacterium]|nr:nucleotidyl transferase AbiEii/AbiGii toxin family protein [Myxococcales bacterium]